MEDSDLPGRGTKCNWKYTALALCAVGLSKEFKPSKSFIVDYAVDHGNFTSSQMVHEILPWTTYTYFGSLVLVLLITDFLRYKPVIILGGIASVACWSVTIWWYESLKPAKLRQVADAISLSTEIAYFTFLYSAVDKSNYHRVTSYSHAALHTGRFLAGLCGQVILWKDGIGFKEMNYVTLGGVSASLLISLFLPQAKRSIYFDTRFSVSSYSPSARGSILAILDSDPNPPPRSRRMGRNMSVGTILKEARKQGLKKRLRRAYRALSRDFRVAYTNRYVLKWSLWWSIAQAIYLQVGLYSESLWKEIEEETHEGIYNGIIDSSHALLSSILAICMVYIRFPMIRWGEIYLTTISLLQAVVLLLMSQTRTLYIAYGCYIAFQTLFEVVIIIATAEVAESIKEDSEAFIFGLNTLLALIFQTILTYAITDESGFDLNLREEFVVYAVYSGLLGVVFFLIAMQHRSRHWDLEQPNKTVEVKETEDCNSTSKKVVSVEKNNCSKHNETHIVDIAVDNKAAKI